jgi:hypothetical protein
MEALAPAADVDPDAGRYGYFLSGWGTIRM